MNGISSHNRGHSSALARPGFRARAAAALADAQLQQALANVPVGFVAKRKKALARLPEFSALARRAAAMRRESLARMEALLTRFVENAEAAGAKVHLARDAGHARAIIRELLRERGARLVVKGKSMTAEEIGLNAALEDAGMEVVETDLGEYIIQLRREPPSHIVAPAIHLRIDDIAEDFRRAHDDLPAQRPLLTAEALAAEARAILRQKFLKADAGITGANALVAEAGAAMLITNEGNGDLCATNPHLHIVVAGVEKLVERFADAFNVMRVLPRSATGQDITVYATFHGGARRSDEADGPAEMHFVLLTDSRKELLRGPFAEMLACIRCGACLNHCPIYQLTGGHAYGRVYSGPMGIVLGRAVFGLKAPRTGGPEGDGGPLLADGVEQACTLCNRCAEVCPVGIDLPRLIRRWRQEAVAAGLSGAGERWAQWLHARVSARPRLYRKMAALGARVLRILRRHPALAQRTPALAAWMTGRSLPEVAGTTFLENHAGTRLEPVEGAAGCKLPAQEQAKVEADEGDSPALPARARVEGAAAVEQFVRFSEEAGAPVHRVDGMEAALKVVREVTAAHGLPPVLFAAPGLALPEDMEDLNLAPDFAPDVPAALVPAQAGVAETGTLLFTSSPELPVRALLLPEVLFALLPQTAVVGGYEQALNIVISRHPVALSRHSGESRNLLQHTQEQAARDPGFRRGDEEGGRADEEGGRADEEGGRGDEEGGRGDGDCGRSNGENAGLPRSLMFITGPSRTADVEQTLVIGAHGPRAVHVLLLRE